MITKSEAIYYLALKVGSADGKFTKDEFTDAVLNTTFGQHLKDIDREEIKAKIKSGSLDKYSAITTLKSLSEEDQKEALAICLQIIIADGEITDAEQFEFVDLCNNFSYISFEEVEETLEEMKN